MLSNRARGVHEVCIHGNRILVFVFAELTHVNESQKSKLNIMDDLFMVLIKEELEYAAGLWTNTGESI